MADYPSAVKTFATLVDGADSVLAAHQNDRGGEITAIETELGTDPAGAYTDVADRLDAVDGSITDLETALYTNTLMDGLKLIWNSATSISVGVGRCFAENGDLINVASALTAGSLSLSNSTWYHVYVYLNSGTPAVEVVTTAPAAWKGTAYSKTSDTSRRYVGSIRTDGSANVYEFLHTAASGLMLYSGDCDLDASPFRALSAGTATTATAVDLSAVIPATAKIGYMRLLSTGSVIVSFGPTSNVTGAALGVGSSTQTSFLGQFPLTASQQYYYKFASAPSGGAYIDVYGYVFER